MKIKWLLLASLLSCSQASWAQIYKWVDADGKVHYSDKKMANAKPQSIKPQNNTSQEDMQQAQQRYEKLKQNEQAAKEKKAARDKNDAEEQAKLAEKKKKCLALYDDLDHVRHTPGVYYKDKNGKDVYIDEKQRSDYVALNQAKYNEDCR